LLHGGPLIIDADRRAAPLEWTRCDQHGRILRGMDWLVFEPETFRIQEVRPYNAAPVQPDIAGRNYWISIMRGGAIPRCRRQGPEETLKRFAHPFGTWASLN
jgi:hypothetical protein